MTDLVERLRTEAHETKIGGPTWGDGEVMHEAADCIETQRAEITRLRGEVASMLDYEATTVQLASRLQDRAEAAEARIKKLEAALERSSIALDDWLNVYAEDMCDEKRVAEAKQRISEFGTLAYIAFVQDQNRTALRSREGEK